MQRARARRTALAVCGSGFPEPGLAEVAEELGRRIVEQGCVLICGGKGGVMEAASRGGQVARSQGNAGSVVGILPDTEFADSNAYCEIVIPSGMGIARNALVVRAADAVILVGGGAGTLSEAAYAWQLGKPLIALVGTGGWADRLAGQPIDATRAGHVFAACSPTEAVARALTEIAKLDHVG